MWAVGGRSSLNVKRHNNLSKLNCRSYIAENCIDDTWVEASVDSNWLFADV